MKVWQVELRQREAGGRMVCWTDADPRLKVGAVISLKGVTGKWVVEKLYKTDRDSASIKRDWRVGGLL
jgi:hypothetical protein